MKYLDKENYIFDFSDEWNRNHNKVKIINEYNNFLGKKCAELGSNSGYHCYIIAEFDNIDNVIGFDINKKALEFGDIENRKKFSTNISNKVKFKYSSLNNIDIEDNYFDSVISFHTLEHIYPEDLNIVIKEMYRILKIGGYAIISLPYEKAFPDKKHVNFFNEEKLRNVFNNNGFYTLECYQDTRMSTNPNQLCLTAVFKKI